ncbi:MAG: CBM50, partial [uncultured Thermomicrobiales bacterium]
GCKALARALWPHREFRRGHPTARSVYPTRCGWSGNGNGDTIGARECRPDPNDDAHSRAERGDGRAEHRADTPCDGHGRGTCGYGNRTSGGGRAEICRPIRRYAERDRRSVRRDGPADHRRELAAEPRSAPAGPRANHPGPV